LVVTVRCAAAADGSVVCGGARMRINSSWQPRGASGVSYDAMHSALLVLSALAAACAAAPPPPTEVTCDVIVAGGSLSAVAAAVTAANVSAALRVCLLEPTDWVGGQLTTSAVPAVDFGPSNGVAINIPTSFAAWLFGPTMPNTTNPGHCWVSKKCFDPRAAVDAFLVPLLARFPNVRVFYNTAVSFARRDAASGALLGVTAVQRAPRAGVDVWAETASAQLADWYDSADSPRFTKAVLDFVLPPGGGAVVEATEFGDVLATSGLPFAQGIEVPAEASRGYLSTCGQGTTVPFYATYGRVPAPSPDPWPPGSGEGDAFAQQGMSWDRDWTYRRVDARAGSDANAGAPGETSVINVGGGNDIGAAYLFFGLDSAELAEQRSAPFKWRGGVNTTALAMAEQRAYGFYHWFKANASGAIKGDASRFISLNASLAGTTHGLAKLPYLRDARRSAGGLGGFRVYKDNLTLPGVWKRAAFAWDVRLTHYAPRASPATASLTIPHTPNPVAHPTALNQQDRIGIGQYFYADIHKEDASFCPYPDYIKAGAAVLPYFIPFRALTVDGAPNLLVSGKNMATSFFAGAAMRLHPEEWVSGVAAGFAAGTMATQSWTTADVLAHVADVRAGLAAMGSPQNWTL
jgi:hypothetical protein